VEHAKETLAAFDGKGTAPCIHLDRGTCCEGAHLTDALRLSGLLSPTKSAQTTAAALRLSMVARYDAVE
jgi:hypothetical protein